MGPVAQSEADQDVPSTSSSRPNRKSYTTSVDKSSSRRGFLQHLAVWIWIGWIFFYMIFFATLPFLYLYFPTALTIIVSLMTFSAFMPIDKKYQPSLGYALGEFIVFRAAEYFHMRMILVDDELVKNAGPSIFAIEPHDILPLSIFAFNDCLGGIRGHKCLGCVTSLCFYVPLMKHVYSWVCARSADRNNLLSMLDKGCSPVLCPGGVQEVTLMKSDKECVLYLNSRFGFIKIALQKGAPIIPCFCFGLRKTFTFWIPKSEFIINMGRHFGVLPMLFFGVWNLPFSPGKPVDYSTVIGIPILLPKIDNPTQEDIAKYHKLYVRDISALYENHKKEFGMEDVTLRIA